MYTSHTGSLRWIGLRGKEVRLHMWVEDEAFFGLGPQAEVHG